MAASADLAEYRILRALRGEQPGAFPSLWNGQAGAIWSVVRAVCSSDTEAVGWMTSFRVELGERAAAFVVDRPLGAQVGEALYAHLVPQFADFSPPPVGPLTPDADGVGRIPSGLRLAWLVALYFDVDAEALPGMDPARVAGLREVARRLEPDETTDAHLLVHTALLRTPPVAVLILPPGSEPATPPSRSGWYALGGALLIALLTSNAVLDHVVRPLWLRWRPAPVVTAGDEPLMQGDPAEIARALAARGVASPLAEVPRLDSLGLHVVGARAWWAPDPTARLLYLWAGERPGVWTLEHRFGGALAEGDVLARSDDGSLEARATALGVTVVWAERDTRWALSADAPPLEVIRMAAAVRTLRAPSGAPSSPGDPATTP